MDVSRIASPTSVPPTVTVGALGSTPMTSGIARTVSATAAASVSSTPDCRHHQVAARYMAPVSRYDRPRLRATALETLDLPEPEGPSIAMTRGDVLNSPVSIRGP